MYDKANAASTTGSGAGSGTGSGTGSGGVSGTPATLTANELKNLIEEVFGGSFEELDANSQLAAAVALDWLFDKHSNVNASALAKEYITQCKLNNHPYVYTQFKEQKQMQFLPIPVMADASGYRYVYSDSRREATLTKRATTYRFLVGSNKITFTDGTQAEMDTYKIEFQDTPYIDEVTAKQYFECEAEYVIDTNYGACLTKQIKEAAEKLYKAFAGE